MISEQCGEYEYQCKGVKGQHNSLSRGFHNFFCCVRKVNVRRKPNTSVCSQAQQTAVRGLLGGDRVLVTSFSSTFSCLAENEKKITSASWALACCCRFWALVFFNNSSFSERSLFQESLTEGKKGRVSKFAYDFLLRQPALSPPQIIQWSIPNLLCTSEKTI